MHKPTEIAPRRSFSKLEGLGDYLFICFCISLPQPDGYTITSGLYSRLGIYKWCDHRQNSIAILGTLGTSNFQSFAHHVG